MCFGSCCQKRRRENNRVYPASESTTLETRPSQPKSNQPITTQPRPLTQTSAPSISTYSQPRAPMQSMQNLQNQQPFASQTSGILKEPRRTVYESGAGRKSITETVIEERRVYTTKQLNDSGASRFSASRSGSTKCDAEDISPEREACESGGRSDPGSRGASVHSRGKSVCESRGRSTIESSGGRSDPSRGRTVDSSGGRSVCETAGRSIADSSGSRSICDPCAPSMSPASRGVSSYSSKNVCDDRSICESNDTNTLGTKTSVCDVREMTKSSENIHRATSKGSNIMDLGDFDDRPNRKISAMQAGACPGRGREPKILDNAETCPKAMNFKSFTDSQKLRVAEDCD